MSISAVKQHQPAPCVLPRIRKRRDRRWLGLVVACPDCHRCYTLTEHCGFLMWESLRG